MRLCLWRISGSTSSRGQTMPLLRPGIIAAWLLVFIASVRELGVSIFLVSPQAKVIAPSIVSAWLSSSSELSAYMALIQGPSLCVHRFPRCCSARRGALSESKGERGAHRDRQSDRPLRRRRRGRQWGPVELSHRRARDPARPLGLRQDDDASPDQLHSEELSGGVVPGSASPVPPSIPPSSDANVSTEKRGGIDGVSVLCDLAAYERVRERRLWAARPQPGTGRHRARGRARAGSGADAQFRDPLGSAAVVGRRAAAARAGARHRLLADCVTMFDEPVFNIRRQIARRRWVELRELQRRLGVTSVYVTHDQAEALAISSGPRRGDGSSGGIGCTPATPEEIYKRPNTRFVADFVGSANLIAGRVTGGAHGAGPVGFDVPPAGSPLQAWAVNAPHGGRGPCRRTHRLYRSGGRGAERSRQHGLRYDPPAPVSRRLHSVHRRIGRRGS